jgi:hypothetical protein
LAVIALINGKSVWRRTPRRALANNRRRRRSPSRYNPNVRFGYVSRGFVASTSTVPAVRHRCNLAYTDLGADKDLAQKVLADGVASKLSSAARLYAVSDART